jgi:plastocyanin
VAVRYLRYLRHLPRSIVVLCLVTLAGTATPVAAQEADGAAVAAQNVQFAPRTLTVPAGTTVTWTNADPFQHSVTADDGSFDSGLVDPRGTFTWTFTDPGTYAYHCMPHGGPGGAGMSGIIVVE